jgi:TetR/AcrR family transcriptional repressor of nem operon
VTVDEPTTASPTRPESEARQHTEHGRERKQQILDAAAELFAARGYGPTRIIDICEAAGVAKGLFYWYFDTKDAVFVELVRSMRRKLRRAQAAAMADGRDPIDRLRLGTRASVHFMAEHQAWFDLLEVRQGDHPTDDADDAVTSVLREGREVYLADVERVIDEARVAGQVPDDTDPRLAALAVMATVSSISHAARHGHLDHPVEVLADFVAEWVVRGLGALTAEPLRRPDPSRAGVRRRGARAS